MAQLTRDFVSAFDQEVTDNKSVPFSVLAGDIDPFGTCSQIGLAGDGVVPVVSAEWNLTDTSTVEETHVQLNGSAADFQNFVLPHLASGRPPSSGARGTNARPGGAARPAGRGLPQPTKRATPRDTGADPQVVLSSGVQLAAGAGADVSISVPSATTLTVTTTAPSTVGGRFSTRMVPPSTRSRPAARRL